MVLTVEEVYPCYCDPFCNVTLKEKRNVYGRMESKILYLLQDIKQCSKYLHKYWYNLKCFAGTLHAGCRLLYKVLKVYSTDGMCTRLKCHTLVHGQRSIAENLLHFEELVKFTEIQVAIIGCLVQCKSSVQLQDQIRQIFFHLVKFLDTLIWHDHQTQNIFRKGLPVQLNFM